jgi:hypothetical protein
MHGFVPLPFSELWTTNRIRNPNHELRRNADNLYVPPPPYKKKLPCPKKIYFMALSNTQQFHILKLWNIEPITKLNPS